MKICVMGFSGSGKSSLAERLSENLGLPVVYLDTVLWLPGWERRPREEQREILGKFLDDHPEGWVVDGTYPNNLFERRTEEADRIILLLFSRLRCLWRIYKRYFKNKGKSRVSMTVGCEEKVDWDFLEWSLFKSRTKEATEKYRELCRKYPDKVTVIRGPRQLKKFLKEEFNLELK